MQGDKAVRTFMHVIGVVLAIIGLMHALAIPLREFGIIPGEVAWKTALIALFLILASVEAFTMNMTKYAGDLLKSLASKIVGKARDDS